MSNLPPGCTQWEIDHHFRDPRPDPPVPVACPGCDADEGTGVEPDPECPRCGGGGFTTDDLTDAEFAEWEQDRIPDRP